ERELLEDGADPSPPGVGDRAEVYRRAMEQDLTGVRPESTGHDADERRFARAVLAKEDVHLARSEVEVQLVERLHTREPLAQPAQAEQRRRLGEDRNSTRLNSSHDQIS